MGAFNLRDFCRLAYFESAEFESDVRDGPAVGDGDLTRFLVCIVLRRKKLRQHSEIVSFREFESRTVLLDSLSVQVVAKLTRNQRQRYFLGAEPTGLEPAELTQSVTEQPPSPHSVHRFYRSLRAVKVLLAAL